MKRKLMSVVLAMSMALSLCISTSAAETPATGLRDYDVVKESAHKTVSAGGYSYDCYTTLYYGASSKGCLWAVERGKKDAEASLRTYLYEDGVAVLDTGWSTSHAYIHYLNTKNRAVSGEIQVKGEYKLYHEGGADHTSGSAPVVSYYAGREAEEERPVASRYPVNGKGETYGSYLDADTVGYAPDLISAKGENDVYGYVRREDFAPDLRTREEVIQWQAEVDRDNMIPLYDLEGNVIGRYALGTSQDQMEMDPVILEQLNEMTGGNAARFMPPEVQNVQTDIETRYPTNSRGETYGSYLDAERYGYAPEWICVKGDNDKVGYIRRNEFRDSDEVVLKVYDLEGNAIDTFTREAGSSEIEF